MDHAAVLLSEIEAFLAAQGMAPSTFGAKFMRDKGFVFDLRKGDRKVWPHTADRVRHAMLAYRPEPKQDAA